MNDKYIIRNCPAFLDDVQLLEFSTRYFKLTKEILELLDIEEIE